MSERSFNSAMPMIIYVRRFNTIFGFVILGLATCGCGPNGPNVAEVTGTVTLDGQPLEGAEIEFQPIDIPNGSPSYSINRTGPDGEYSLQYNDTLKGAMVGEHKVRITTFQQISTDEGGGEIPEQLGPEYNTKTELTATVKAGKSNVCNFDLKSK